ncbi:MAG: tRNA preQ1(34) S-adenosylmethionine ribosyltransferase-isomerase QueA [Candidatus Latescibacterota bacterium]
MNLEEYDYPLPPELIAQNPAEERDHSRLMVLDPAEEIRHRLFRDIPEYFSPGDVLVVNDTRVFPARLVGKKEDTGGDVELLLLRPSVDGSWEALARPAKRLRVGTPLLFGEGILRALVTEKGEYGQIRVRLESNLDINAAVDRVGQIPLPRYIRREPETADCERYQTVYARVRGAVAAPTAGLHFTPAILETLAARGVIFASVTLHVGIGTFRPLTEEDAEKNHLHSEYCLVSKTTADAVHDARRRGGRVFAVGTTTVRALETASVSGELRPFEGFTEIFIKPPYAFRSVDALITNFHLPRSSLLMMVSAFAGRERMLEAYRIAVQEGYRFYSYGDAMLILKK